MSSVVLVAAATLGGFAAVTAWVAAMTVGRSARTVVGDTTASGMIRRLAALERLKLLLMAVFAVIVIGLSLAVNETNRNVQRLEDVRVNQDCIIALLRTPGVTVTDAQLAERGCPTPPPFRP